jgi:hypothetical protein
MKYMIIDFPHPQDKSFYQRSLERMTQRLMQSGSVKSVYQVGGISSPGISDLDMVAVFEDGVRVDRDFLKSLSKEERYLFIHNLYGISAGDFQEASQFAFYHNYSLLGGEDTRKNMQDRPQDAALSIQVAMEFLVKMHTTIFMQESYGVLRMRDLLLHVKALQYDLDLLAVTWGGLFDHVSQVIRWRKSWFVETPSTDEILTWWTGFVSGLRQFLEQELMSHPFYLPPGGVYRISKNVYLFPADKFASSRQGFVLPEFFSAFGKKFFRLQNRLNSFRFEIPVKSTMLPAIIESKFRFEKKIVEYNRNFLPHFLPLTSSLHVF